MDVRVKIDEPEHIAEDIIALLAEMPNVPLVVTGGSMTPFLVHERDVVYLSKIERSPKRGDIVLYRRDNGAYVLHRVFRTDGDFYTMLGDAQTCPEYGVRPDQIRAVVTAACRKGKLIQKGCLWWDFFERVWIRIVPLRPAVRKSYDIIKRKLLKKEFYESKRSIYSSHNSG